MNETKWTDIILRLSMRLISSEVLIIASVTALTWGTEHVQLAIGGLLGYITREVQESIQKP